MSVAAITGVGVVGPNGIGLDALADALATGAPCARPADTSAGYHARASGRTAALVPDLDLHEWVPPMQSRRMSRPSLLAAAAARMAAVDGGLGADALASDDTAVAMATAFGPGTFTERLLIEILDGGPRAASPFLFTDSVANAPAGQIAILHGARGANATICQREAGALLALAHGAREATAGRAARCLAGTVDEAGTLLHALLGRMRAVCRPEATRAELPRPFDRARNGFLLGEGSAVLVVETVSAATGRGARQLARVVASVRAFDPTASRSSWGRDAVGLGAALRNGLQRQGVDPASIDVIVSGASGSRAGDRLEALVLREVWSELPPVVTPRAVTGEYGIGTVPAALLALRGATFGRPQGCTSPDPELGIVPYAGPVDARRVLLSALASGGAAAWLVLERP